MAISIIQPLLRSFINVHVGASGVLRGRPDAYDRRMEGMAALRRIPTGTDAEERHHRAGAAPHAARCRRKSQGSPAAAPRNRRNTEFKAFDYISAARTHFGMIREEASQLTMTEFQMLLAAKYPDQKGFTREEYDAIADDYMAKKAKRLALAEQAK
jgi:hypothetical protein